MTELNGQFLEVVVMFYYLGDTIGARSGSKRFSNNKE